LDDGVSSDSNLHISTMRSIYMSDEANLSAAPEPDPGCKSGDLEPLAEVFDGNIQPETRQTEGDVEDGKPNPELPQVPSDKHNEGSVKPTISARKLAANRQNATRSCGPKTEHGKANSSKNAIKHGIFAGKLFSQTEQAERLEYEDLAAQLVDHYQPIGFKEELLVEQIFTELVRSGRILKYEQRVLSEAAVFMGQSLEKVLRYSAYHSRQLSRLLGELEGEQAKRQSR
jgi:hypothetical protein